VVTKVFGSLFSSFILLFRKKMLEFCRDWLERWKRDLSLIAAHAKLVNDVSGCSEAFRHPMKGLARRAQYVHLSKAVDHPGRIKWLACNSKLWFMNTVIVQKRWWRWRWRWRWKMNDMIDQRRYNCISRRSLYVVFSKMFFNQKNNVRLTGKGSMGFGSAAAA
jgi:hypothetical protein